MQKIPKFFFLNLFVALGNFWIWKILKEDLIVGLLLILVSLLLSLYYSKFSKTILTIILVLTLLLGTKILMSGFDNNLTRLSTEQQKQLNERHGIYSIELGRYFQNKIALHFYKDISPSLNVYANNSFNSLSPNLYFFTNHPREREKTAEQIMYSPIFLIPFLVGLISQIKLTNKFIAGYFLLVFFITGFIRQNYLLGPILFFPVINLLITSGLIRIYLFFRK